jgi:3'(2'), 5'-bisphosphate nucleotidase
LRGERVRDLCDEGVRLEIVGLIEEVGCEVYEVWCEGLEGMGVERKRDGSLVTRADRQSEKRLREGLLRLVPEVLEVVSEEDGREEEPDGVGEGLCWVVDPLDGTHGFVEGREEFTINVALLEGRVPIVGFLHKPVLGETLWGWSMGGCRGVKKRERRGGEIEDLLLLSGERKGDLTVVCSRARGGVFAERMGKKCPEVRLIRQDAAVKFVTLLQGDADVYVQLGETHVWDTASAQVMVESMGGGFWNMDGSPYEIGDYRSKNGPFFAVRCDKDRDVVMEKLRRVGY